MPETLDKILKHYPINSAGLARRLGINENSMWKYRTGRNNISKKRLEEIQNAIRELGRELAEVTLVKGKQVETGE